MESKQFQTLSQAEIGALMRKNGRKVVAFPFNGTRRWFLLEKREPEQDFLTAYHDAITTRQIEICEMLFAYGVDTIVMPLLSPYLFESRGEQYTDTAVAGLSLLTDHPKFTDFYTRRRIKVSFYGEYEQYLAGGRHAGLIEKFEKIHQATAQHSEHRLCWGICAHDATQTAVSLAIEYYKQYGIEPDKEALIEQYYGSAIPPIDIFITASKPRAFDVPLLSNGREDLYYTVAPSPYFNEAQLRAILYDHLFARQKENSTYSEMEAADWQALRQFYRQNETHTLGVGKRIKSWGLWTPIPQVNIPKELNKNESIAS